MFGTSRLATVGAECRDQRLDKVQEHFLSRVAVLK